MFLYALSDAGWRAVLALAAGFSPYSVPPEAIGARTPLVAAVRLAILVGVALGVSLAVRRLGSRSPRTALLCALALLAVPIAAAYFSGDRGPLLRGAWITTPLVWTAIAAVLGGPLAARLTRSVSTLAARRVAIGLTTAGLAMGAASFALAYPALSSRDAMWSQALANNPGDENAARAVAVRERSQGNTRAAFETFATCRRLRPKSCTCAEGAADQALDLGRYYDAREALDATVTCERSGRRMALTAEALIGTRELEAGLREAELALGQNRDEPHAVYARAWGAYLKGGPSTARADAKRAVDLGRGTPARLLYGLLLFNAGDLDLASAEFQAILAAEPDNVQATYDAALVAQKKNQYRDAREGYLRALKLDPTLSDARYNLAVLTYAQGATMEAQHHVDEFAAAYPSDPRIAALRQILATPPPRRALTVGD